MKIEYSPQARTDLKEMNQYVAQVLHNPTAAKKLTEGLVRGAHLLAGQPELGVEMRDKLNRDVPYRCLIKGNFGIFYAVTGESIRIVRILDLRTDYLRTLFAE